MEHPDLLNLHGCDREILMQITADARKTHPNWSGPEIKRYLYSQLKSMNREDLLIAILKLGAGINAIENS